MKLLWTTKKNFLWRNLPRAIDGIKLLFDSERCLDHTYFLFIFFSSKKGNEGKKVFFFFFVSTKKQLAKMMNFLNVYCNRIYTKQKLFSFCSPTPPHKLWKKQNLISEKCVQYFTQQRSFYTLLFFLFIQPHLLLLFFL